VEEQVTREMLLQEIRAARAEWDALLEEVGEDRMLEPRLTAGRKESPEGRVSAQQHQSILLRDLLRRDQRF
jgi:hypothetical protein